MSEHIIKCERKAARWWHAECSCGWESDSMQLKATERRIDRHRAEAARAARASA